MLNELWDKLDIQVPRWTSSMYITNAKKYSSEAKMFMINKITLSEEQKAYYSDIEVAQKKGILETEFPIIHLKYFRNKSNVTNLVELGHIYFRKMEQHIRVIIYLNEKSTYEIDNMNQVTTLLEELEVKIDNLKET